MGDDHCRTLSQGGREVSQAAAAESSPALRDQLLGYARQYDALASIMEEVPPPALPAKHQRQPMQQQQSKAEPDDTQ